jgi:hypothetical protein
MSSAKQQSEYERFQELTRKFQILDQVYEAFGDPDQSPYCGFITPRAERLAELQHWRDEQAKRRGDRTPAPPEWERVRHGPKWIYTRLSDSVDVHVGIAVDGRVAIKLFNKGEDDAA